MKKLTRKAFTLVELLIVIAIIGILAVTALIALNPAETQKKARDTSRIKDANDLQAAFEQYIDANSAVTVALVTSSTTTSTATNTGIKTMPCAAASNWIGIDLCPYIKTVPVDPSNGADRTYVGNATAARMYYRAAITAGNYEINVRQESTANANKVTGDGGDSAEWFEIFNGPNTVITGP